MYDELGDAIGKLQERTSAIEQTLEEIATGSPTSSQKLVTPDAPRGFPRSQAPESTELAQNVESPQDTVAGERLVDFPGIGPPDVAAEVSDDLSGRSFAQGSLVKWVLTVMTLAVLSGWAYLNQYAFGHGWTSAPGRAMLDGIWGLVAVATGYRISRSKLRVLGPVIIALGIAWLYRAVVLLAPEGIFAGNAVISADHAFALMCAVTILALGVSLLARLQSIAVISMVGAFASPALLDVGQTNHIFLMSYLLGLNTVFLGAAALTKWQILSPLAVIGTGIAFGNWYLHHYTPGGYEETIAFAWCCAALLAGYAGIGIATGRVGSRLGVSVVILGALGLSSLILATSESPDFLHPLGIQVLILTGGLCAFGVWREWRFLTLLSGLLGVGVFGGWAYRYYLPWAGMDVCIYAWCMFTLLAAVSLYARGARWGRWHEAEILLISSVLGCCWIVTRDVLSLNALAGQVLVFGGIVLSLGILGGWQWARVGVWIWTAVVFAFLLKDSRSSGQKNLLLAGWIWGSYALLMSDVLIRGCLRCLQSIEIVDALLAIAATGLMYTATCSLLRGQYEQWTIAYTAALAVTAFGLSWVLYRAARRRILCCAFLLQGLMLAAMAASTLFSGEGLFRFA